MSESIMEFSINDFIREELARREPTGAVLSEGNFADWCSYASLVETSEGPALLLGPHVIRIDASSNRRSWVELLVAALHAASAVGK